jgi:hypothetical protein
MKLKLALIGVLVLGVAPLACADDFPTSAQATRSAAAGWTRPWPAPVGHRQPKAGEIAGDEQHSAIEKQLGLDRAFDGKLRICSSC